VKVSCQGNEVIQKHVIVGPFLEMPVAGLIGRVAFRQVLPPGTGAEYPEDAVKDGAWRRGWSPFTISTFLVEMIGTNKAHCLSVKFI
jgi:hypothetical protein